jgi:hypothetical protein
MLTRPFSWMHKISNLPNLMCELSEICSLLPQPDGLGWKPTEFGSYFDEFVKCEL